MMEIGKSGLLRLVVYLFDFIILPFCLSCKGKQSDSHWYERRDIQIPGIYPKIFPCLGRTEKICIYYTGEDGSIWFFPIDNTDKPVQTIAHKAKYGTAIPIVFFQNLTGVVEIRNDNPNYFLMVNGLTSLAADVSFVSANTQTLIFGDSVYREVLLIIDQQIIRRVIPNDKNILFETEESKDIISRDIDVVGGWSNCSSVFSDNDSVEGVVFSEIFSALNYFFFSKDRTISEFIGWDEVEETSSPEYLGIPSLYSLKLKKNAYPSVNSAKISPNYTFGFLDPNTIIFVSPLSPPTEIKLRYLETSKKYLRDSCSISSDGGITYIFGSDKKELIMFQKKQKWIREKVADFSAGEILSFIYKGSPCVLFTNLKDMSLKFSCKSGNIWNFREIDSGFIYSISMYNDGQSLLVIYNVIDDRGSLKIRIAKLKLD